MIYDILYPFQKGAVSFTLEAKTAGLFCEMGVGKTFITAGVIEKLIDNTFTALLVVPLANIVTTWEDILEKLDVSVCRDWDSFKKADAPKILLIHYEAMPKVDRQITKYSWSLVVFDESQKIKSRGSRQSRIAGRIKNVKRRIILSGSPFDDPLSDPQELWAQMRFMNPEVFGRRWRDYEDAYLRPSGYMGYKRVFRRGKLAKVLSLVEPYILRLTKEDVLDLPPIEYINVPVKIFGEQKRIYREMKKDMVTTVKGNDVTADLVITQLVKLQQICGGFVSDDEDEVHEVGRAKLRKLKRIVKQAQFPIVIFTKYRYELAQIHRELSGGNHRIAIIDGKTRKTRTQTVRDFQAGKTDILIAQVKTGGVGIDLFRSCVAIFYSTTFSYIDFEQAVARIHRNGQVQDVKVYLLYVENTVDKSIYETLLLKRDICEDILTPFKPDQGDPIMANKKTNKKPADKPAKDKTPEMKYGISDLAEALGVKPAGVRTKLRNAKVKKVGSRYGWDTKAELNEVVDLLKAKMKKDDD